MNKIFIILLILFSFWNQATSQSKNEKKEFKKKFLEAEYFFLLDEFEESAFLYSELLKSDPDNANLQFLTGASYLSIPGKKNRAIPYLEKAVTNISPSYREGSYKERHAPKECLFAIARAYHINNQLKIAQKYYEKFKTVMQLRDVAEIEYINKQIKSIGLAQNMIKDTLNLNISSLINNEYNETSRYQAVYAESDSVLLYMSDLPFFSAILMTKFENGYWKKPIIINGQLKIDGKLKLCSISFDGKDLYLSRKENYNSEIFHSAFQNGKWSKAEALPENINTIFNETHAALSADKNTLYFTSDQPGGYGAMDIYLTHKKPNGKWGEAINLGKPINSIYSEESPYITHNGKTLYFSSMSHATMGGYDLFYSTKLPDNHWSYPANLGFPLSTSDDDLHYFPINNGKQALYTGTTKDFPTNDIALIFPAGIDPEKLISLKGKIIPDDNLLIDTATHIQLKNLETNKIVANTHPKEISGSYSFDVPAGNYEILIESEGYDTLKEEVSILKQHQTKEVNLESKLTPEEVASGQYVVAKNIFFGFDSSELSNDAKFEIEKLNKIMADNPEMLIELTGHTDSKGAADYNLRLSNKRSQKVVDYLVARGISKERFISKAVGEDKNMAINQNPDGSDNPQGRKFNRQVELKIVNNGQKNIWLEEYMVPEQLKPAAQKKYYVILADNTKELKIIQQSNDERIKLYETGRKHIYAAGSFANKRNAIEYLNEIIETDFPEGRIVDENEFNYLLKPSVPDLKKTKGPFTIQLLALKKAISLNEFNEYPSVRQIQSKDGFYRYIAGVFDEYVVAQDSLVNYVLKGFSDAFIIPISRFDQTLGEGQLLPDHYDFYYTIQFSATRKPANSEYFAEIQNILTLKGKDGFYRYSSGIFLNKLEAEKKLKKIKILGFSDAFIKKICRNN